MAAPPGSSARRPPLEPGARLGDYVVDSLIGRGGYARVYRARHVGSGGEVALKVLRGDGDTQRFLREAETLAALRHPNIVRTLGSGATAGGAAYLALELIEGETLADRIARGGALGEQEVAWVADGTLAALEAAHAAGVFHRDIKPSNILLTEAGGRLEVKLIDFGVSRVAGATRLTATGALVGTPAYSSPELLGAESHDHRTDLWSVGAVLFECLAGRRAFDGTILEVITKIVGGEPPDLFAVPPTLRPLIAALLLPQARRIAGATEARARLRALQPTATPTTIMSRRLLTGDTSSAAAPPPPSAGRGAPPTRPFNPPTIARPDTRRPPARDPRMPWALLIAGALGLLSLAAVLGVAGGWWLNRSAAPAESSGNPSATTTEPAPTSCPRAYECCVEAVTLPQDDADDIENHRLRCRARTRPGPSACGQHEMTYCDRQQRIGPCRWAYDCCIAIAEENANPTEDCESLLLANDPTCLGLRGTTYGEDCGGRLSEASEN